MDVGDYLLHLRFSRFVFDADPHTEGAEFSVRCSQVAAPSLLAETPFVTVGPPRPGHAHPEVAVYLQAHAVAVPLSGAALSRPRERVFLLQLVRRDHTGEVVAASGTLDANMFVGAPLRPYAVTLESNFFSVGRLHLTLQMAPMPPGQRQALLEETGAVVHVERVRRLDAPLDPAAAYQVKVYFDGDGVTSTPMASPTCGDLVLRHTVVIKPLATKMGLSLWGVDCALGRTSIRLERLLSQPLPRDFTLPLRLEAGGEAEVLFTVREEAVGRRPRPPSPRPAPGAVRPVACSSPAPATCATVPLAEHEALQRRCAVLERMLAEAEDTVVAQALELEQHRAVH